LETQSAIDKEEERRELSQRCPEEKKRSRSKRDTATRAA